MTVLNLVLHSDDKANGSSRAMEQFNSGEAASPLVAPNSLHMNPPIPATRKGRSTAYH